MKNLVLRYTDKEKEALRILQHHSNELNEIPLRYVGRHFGIATAIIISLIKKGHKVESGCLSNPEGLPYILTWRDNIEIIYPPKYRRPESSIKRFFKKLFNII